MKTGRLTLYLGPMFAGKTTALRLELERHANLGAKVVYINHIFDTRNKPDNLFSTHSQIVNGKSDKMTDYKTAKLSDINVDDFDAIGIDEGQFFDDLEQNVIDWVQVKHKDVFISGLDGDFRQKIIGRCLNLIPFADTYYKLTAGCQCCYKTLSRYVPAPFTLKLSHISSTSSSSLSSLSSSLSDQIEIGGSDKYIPVCRYHYEFFQ